MRDFFTFRRMITPILIQIVYWMLIVGVPLGALVLVALATWNVSVEWLGFVAFTVVLIFLILGFLAIRVFTEIPILAFRVSETITDIRNATIQEAGAKASTPNKEGLRDFLTFRRMITPVLIRIVFWILFVCAILANVAFPYVATDDLFHEDAAGIFLGLTNGTIFAVIVFLAVQITADHRTRIRVLWLVLFVLAILACPYAIYAVFEVTDNISYDRYVWMLLDERQIIGGLIVVLNILSVIALLVARIIAECFMVTFVVNDNLTDIRNTKAKRATDTASVASGGAQLMIKDFLTFRRMVAPILIQVWYWFLTVFVILLFWLNTGDMNPVLRLLLTVASLIPVLLIVRLFTEMSLVLFRINGTLSDIRTLTVRLEGRAAANETSSISDFLTFRRMIAPILIQALYWILIIGIGLAIVWEILMGIIVRIRDELREIIYGYEYGFYDILFQGNETSFLGHIWADLLYKLYEITDMFSGMLYDDTTGSMNPLTIVLLLGIFVFVQLVIRIYAEQSLLVFRINETLTDIRNATRRQTGAVTHDRPGLTIADFLTFRRMITPIVIQVCYWLLMAGVVILALWVQSSGFLEDIPGGILIVGILLVVGLLVVRIVTEVVLTAFRINGTLTDIRSPTIPQAEATGTEPTPQPDTASAETPMKACPYCAETIPYAETRCRYCRSDVPNESESSGQ